jgi:ATP-binding protein involved in chromosome partitioning
VVAPLPGPELEDLEVVRSRIRAGTAGIERTLAVMSGKGGVGKSAVAVNLAVALAQSGSRVGLLDADLNGPSVAKMLGLRGQPVRVSGAGIRPVPGPVGLCVQSMDFFLQGNQPLEWVGPAGEGAALRSALEDAAIADLLGRTWWGELDLLVLDLAPGADRLPALARLLPTLGGALAVTLPTEVSLLAVERSIRRAREARVPLVGLVENLGSAVCAACGAEAPLFREASTESVARELDVELVARIPFDARLAADADAGRPFLAGPHRDSPAGRAFATLARHVAGWEPPGREGEGW